MALCLFSFMISGCGHEFETQYANQRVRSECGSIKVGDSVETVYQKLDEPLFAEVNRDRVGGGGWRKEKSDRVDLRFVQGFAHDTNVALYLHYSRPSDRARGYLRYEVDVSGGKVIHVSAGVLVD